MTDKPDGVRAPGESTDPRFTAHSATGEADIVQPSSVDDEAPRPFSSSADSALDAAGDDPSPSDAHQTD